MGGVETFQAPVVMMMMAAAAATEADDVQPSYLRLGRKGERGEKRGDSRTITRFLLFSFFARRRRPIFYQTVPNDRFCVLMLSGKN